MTDLEEIIKELDGVLANMDVPSGRKGDIKWLARNLSIRNKNHPDFDKAINLIQSFQQGMQCHMMFDGNGLS